MSSSVLRVVSDRTTVTILVAEDHILTRMEVAEFLRSCGYHVLEAANGQEGQSIFRQESHVDFLFTDIDMPLLSGFDLAKWVRLHFPHTGILLGSGAYERDNPREYEEQFGTVMPKPYNLDEVLSQIIKRLEKLRPT